MTSIRILLIAATIMLLSACWTTVADAQEIQRELMPLERVLNTDGTLDTRPGYYGTLDPRGFRLSGGPGGAPRFVRSPGATASSPDDVSWDDRFAPPGPDGGLSTVILHGDTMIVGGSFSVIGNIEAHNVAMWDGSAWSPLGAGTDGVVNAMLLNGPDLYVGGDFSTAGGLDAASVAKWDGAAWTPLGSGMAGVYCRRVEALAMMGGELYAGGCFDTAGGVSTSGGIARWDGSAWHALGSSVGIWGAIEALASIGSDLYAGGSFENIQGTAANSVARWDGSSWHPLGSGVLRYNPYWGDYRYGFVYGLAVSGADLYVCGWFDSAGGVFAKNVAKWNGAVWSALGAGSYTRCNAVITDGADVYVSGADADPPYVGRWDGASWTNIGGGLEADGISYWASIGPLAIAGGTLIAAGNFSSAGGSVVAGVAKYSGGAWSPLDGFEGYHGMLWNGGSVNALSTNGREVFAGGRFVLAGHAVGRRIAKWDGAGWSAIGGGVAEAAGDVYVSTVVPEGNTVYVGGTFGTVPGSSSLNIARWDGASWSGFGSTGLNDVYVIAVVGTDIYVGGAFQNVGEQPIAGIVKWDGSSWSSLGSGLSHPFGAMVFDIAVKGTDIYVAGRFTTAGGVTNIAKWNGSVWSAVGSPISVSSMEYLHSVKLSGDRIIVGGSCAAINNIGQSTGGAWSSIGGGVNGAVMSIATAGTDLYAGGLFTAAGGESARNVAKWNGAAWSALGSGTDSTVRAMVISGADLYVGGDFLLAGGKPSSYVGRWHLPFGHFVALPETLSFGDIAVGSGRLDSIVIVNMGYAALTISSAVSSSAEFVVSPVSGTIAPGDSQKYYLTFTPAASGARSAAVVFHHTGVTLSDTVELDGSGVGAEFVVSPTAVAFGIVPPGSVTNDSLLVRNTGLLPLVISSVSTGDPDLSIDPPAATIAPSDSQRFHLTFSPAGFYLSKTDTIRFTHNGGAAPSIVLCTATGVATVTDTSRNDWNLLSLPMHVTDNLKTAVYPSASSHAYGYSGSYQRRDTLRMGEGYWIGFGGSQPLTYSGNIAAVETVAVRKGWNIIGSLSAPVEVSSVISLPGDIVTSQFFGYSGSYDAVSTIRPGRGYWVKVNQAGSLVLSTSTSAALSPGRIIPSLTDELPPPPPGRSGGEEASDPLPGEFALGQNHPNPFNPATEIQFSLPVGSMVTLKIFNVLGQDVETLVNGVMDAGTWSVRWNANNLPNGVYLYTITGDPVIQGSATPFRDVRKMVLMK